MATTPRQFRLPDETLETIDALATYLSLPSRAAVIRLAISRLGHAELPKGWKPPRKKTLPKPE